MASELATEDNVLNVVAVGASAGGVEALTHFAAGMLSERYEAIAGETEHAMTVLGRRLPEASAKPRVPDG